MCMNWVRGSRLFSRLLFFRGLDNTCAEVRWGKDIWGNDFMFRGEPTVDNCGNSSSAFQSEGVKR